MIYKIFFIVCLLYLFACSTSNITPQPTQNIVSSDTSITSGNLQVTVYDNASNKVAGADVFLYLSYDDIKRNLYVLYLRTASNGLANFGYINTGNYYIRASANIAGIQKSDTAVVQVQSRRVIFKNSILD
ncbi:MAG: hypothetical protein EAZ53_06475 [Bacteroidetes bacterium]|nr:MAG: hypothetical protein EAZ53_06475 [Bacteroidota bacterium]